MILAQKKKLKSLRSLRRRKMPPHPKRNLMRKNLKESLMSLMMMMLMKMETANKLTFESSVTEVCFKYYVRISLNKRPTNIVIHSILDYHVLPVSYIFVLLITVRLYYFLSNFRGE